MKPRMIDANELIAKLNEKKVVGRFNVVRLIEEAPTVNDKAYAIGYAAGSREGYKKGIEDARPTGEWKQDINGWHVCSNCHMIYKGMPTINRNPRWLYCPTCGARMKKEASR